MIKDMEHNQDDKTVLLDRQGHGPAQSPLTDFAAPPRFEQLEERMIYAARLRPAESFNISLNSLVAAASDLLSEVVRLKHSDTREDMYALNERLTSGLKLFEVRALHNGAESSQVMAARYVLCTVVDEAVVTTPWGNESEWSQMSLLSSFHNETFGGEKFFQLLDRLSKNPVKRPCVNRNAFSVRMSKTLMLGVRWALIGSARTVALPQLKVWVNVRP